MFKTCTKLAQNRPVVLELAVTHDSYKVTMSAGSSNTFQNNADTNLKLLHAKCHRHRSNSKFIFVLWGPKRRQWGRGGDGHGTVLQSMICSLPVWYTVYGNPSCT